MLNGQRQAMLFGWRDRGGRAVGTATDATVFVAVLVCVDVVRRIALAVDTVGATANAAATVVGGS